MATNLPSSNHADEDYIDIEVSSTSNFLCYSINSPPQTREFEFQMSSAPEDREPTPSPADELFYKGKLLPLHLPPRLQMVQKLLRNPNTTFDNTKEAFETPSTNCPINPLEESCNISSSDTCRVSCDCELNPDEYFFEWSTELNGFISDNPKKSWSNKLKLIKQYLLGQKIKASRAYLKSMFSKSACSDESSAKNVSIREAAHVSKGKECVNKYIKMAKKNPFGEIKIGMYPTLANVMKSNEKGMIEDGVNSSHRKSFSGAIKWDYATKSSSLSSSSSSDSSLSSSFSINSSGFYELQFLKRNSSAISETESSIEGAIAHCKQSQQLFSPSKEANGVGLCSLSASRIAVSGDKER